LRNSIAYILLVVSIIPIVVGYAWLLIATFSYRTEGLLPKDAEGNIGGWTLANWQFITDPLIWRVTLNSLLIALGMVVGVGFASSLAGYALSRMNFAGRKGFLSMTLVLHAFPSVTLLISIFFVLQAISAIPSLGKIFGYNTVGGVALVMISLDLPRFTLSSLVGNHHAPDSSGVGGAGRLYVPHRVVGILDSSHLYHWNESLKLARLHQLPDE